MSCRQKFYDWLENEKVKKNSTIMKMETYKIIIECVRGSNLNVHENIKKRILRRKYRIMSYPTLGIKDVLCEPCQVSISFTLFLFMLHVCLLDS